MLATNTFFFAVIWETGCRSPPPRSVHKTDEVPLAADKKGLPIRLSPHGFTP
jgi:hypothetical protein